MSMITRTFLSKNKYSIICIPIKFQNFILKSSLFPPFSFSFLVFLFNFSFYIWCFFFITTTWLYTSSPENKAVRTAYDKYKNPMSKITLKTRFLATSGNTGLLLLFPDHSIWIISFHGNNFVRCVFDNSEKIFYAFIYSYLYDLNINRKKMACEWKL